MSTKRLTEFTVTLIEDHLKANMATALSDIRTDRGDAKVPTPAPLKESYFRYERARGFRAPAIFTICQSMRMQNVEKGANYISAKAQVTVSALVENRVRDDLVFQSWRYQAALHQLLHETSLTTGDGKVRLVTKVDDMQFSPVFSDTKNPDDSQSVFRKEVALILDVDHWENL